MPRMYRIVSADNISWEYVDEDTDQVLAESKESYDSEEEAEKAIDEMKKAKVKRGRGPK